MLPPHVYQCTMCTMFGFFLYTVEHTVEVCPTWAEQAWEAVTSFCDASEGGGVAGTEAASNVRQMGYGYGLLQGGPST